MAKVVKADIAALVRENDRLKFENERLYAVLEYVAMMTDVEIDFETETEEAEVAE